MKGRHVVLVCALVALGGGSAWMLRASRVDGLERDTGAALAPSPGSERDRASTPLAPATTPTVAPAARETVATLAEIVLEGTVIDGAYPGLRESAAPAPATPVRLGLSREIDGSREFHATTDPSGAFRFALPDPGERPLEAWLSAEETDDYRARTLRAKLAQGERTRSGLVLERAAHGEIEGVVVDERGAPRGGALVTFRGESAFMDSEPERRRETTADAEGRFALRAFRGAASVLASAPGWRQIDATPMKRRDEGGWEPVRLVLRRSAGLRVTVQDAAGEPMAGVEVALDVSADEPDARREFTGSGGPRERLAGTSAEDGSIDFTDVWCDVELRCTVKTPIGLWSSERQREGVLLEPGHAGPAEAVVVPRGSASELSVRVRQPRVVRGVVLHPDRAPASGAHVWISRHGAAQPRDGFYSDVVTDEAGRFEWRELLLPTPEALVLTASHPAAIESWGSVLYTSACVRRVPFAAVLAEEPIELVLEPALGVDGTVRHADGRPVAGRVAYRRPGAREWISIYRGSKAIDEDGRFAIAGLLPGEYDLEVQLGGDFVFGWATSPRPFPGIAAGTRGLELVVEEPEVARVELEATLDGEPMKFDRVLGTVWPHPELARGDALPQHAATVRRLDGWPAPAPLGLLRGQSSGRDASGEHSFTYLDGPGPMSVAPGWLWIGVRGWQTDGAMLHPTGLGLVYLEPGEYRFRFELTRTGDLSGRIVGAPLEPDLCVALVDANGGAVQVRRRTWTVDVVSPTGASGAFLLQGAPVGRFTLRVGSESELRAGVARHSQEVVIVEGENAPLEVRLR